MNYEVIDTLYRSRLTLLEHLEASGYDTTPYRKFSQKEIAEMVKAGPPALGMTLKKKENENQLCQVVYTINKIKSKISTFTQAIIDPETGFNPETTELIIITLEPIDMKFHSEAYLTWSNQKVKVRYFQAASIINNPLKHVLVPPHEIVPKDQEEALLKDMSAKKSQLPMIRFHEDPIARLIGANPGDIVKITRPSTTAGECVIYRVCVP